MSAQRRRSMTAPLLALLAAAGGCPGEPCAPGWKSVYARPGRAVLAIWGRGEQVYLAGGGLGAGQGALLLRYDGGAWHEVDTGRSESLWWIWGSAGGGGVWAVGEQGLI